MVGTSPPERARDDLSWLSLWALLGLSCDPLGALWGHLRRFPGRLDAIWGRPGTFWGPLGPSWRDLGAFLGASRSVVGAAPPEKATILKMHIESRARFARA